MKNQPLVLVVDDDPEVLDMVSDFLAGEGFSVTTAANVAEARRLMRERPAQLAVVDRRMPGEDGIALVRHLREHYPTGIIMLTAADSLTDRVVGLEVGADDYVVKPFDLPELTARIRSVLRRIASPEVTGEAGGRLRFGSCLLDLGSRKLFDEAGFEIPITSMEYDLLAAFARHPNRPLSRDKLLDMIQQREWGPFDRSIDLHITRLRRKIEKDRSKPSTIKTIRGVGYMFVSHPPA